MNLYELTIVTPETVFDVLCRDEYRPDDQSLTVSMRLLRRAADDGSKMSLKKLIRFNPHTIKESSWLVGKIDQECIDFLKDHPFFSDVRWVTEASNRESVLAVSNLLRAFM